MRSHTGVARRMFGALAERGINIRMINTSEVRLSVVVDRARGEERPHIGLPAVSHRVTVVRGPRAPALRDEQEHLVAGVGP